jgi:hypothetical protein
MKRNKWVKGLCLTILLALGGGSLAYAGKGGNASPNALKSGDQIQSHNQRQKMQFSIRKEAAKRLKKLHGEARAKHMQHEIEIHGNQRGKK